MSLPEAPDAVEEGDLAGPTRRRVLSALLCASLTAPVLAACGESGFRPLHGTASIGAEVSDKLAKVELAPIPGRVGQRIRNELLFQTTGGPKPDQPTHRLEIAVRESITSTLIRPDGEARAAVYNLDARFKLIRLADKEVVLQGTSTGRAGFERFTSIFANVRAREDAENRAASTVGTELKTRLQAFMATQA